MEQNLDHTVALLSRTPAALNALLRDLPDAWTRSNEGENTWNVLDVIGHLVHGEKTDWLPRTRIILKFGESRPFEPFDMAGHEKEVKGKSLSQLLDEFAALRSSNLAELRSLNLSPADLAKRGAHPELGVVTLSQLLASWAVHDLTHLHQMSRIMAEQYRHGLGEWARYMGVMKCKGHSEK